MVETGRSREGIRIAPPYRVYRACIDCLAMQVLHPPLSATHVVMTHRLPCENITSRARQGSLPYRSRLARKRLNHAQPLMLIVRVRRQGLVFEKLAERF